MMAVNNTASDLYQDYNPARREHSAPAPLLPRLFASLVAQPYVLGIDISHWNAFVDFPALKAAGYEFVILKATEGVTYTDPTFAARWPAALDAGLLVGPYHFFRSNLGGANQADYHLNAIRPLWEAGRGMLPPANDIETADGSTVAARVPRITAWQDTVRGALHLDPLCYSSPYLWQQLTNNMVLDCIGWTAHWTSAAAPSWPVGWPAAKRKFWQRGVYPKHSWIPPVPGVTGEVDVNYFYGTLEELGSLAGINELTDTEKLNRLWSAHPELHA